MTAPTEHPAAAVLERDDGPFVTAYLPTDSAVEDAGRRLLTATRSAAGALSETDVEAPTRRLVSHAKRLDHSDADHMVVVADREDAWAWPLASSIEDVSTFASSLPRVAPLLRADQTLRPHVVVRIDREGADVDERDGLAGDGSFVVEGDTEHLRRSAPGGWSQRRFQQRAEETWEDNARDVAEEVREACDRIGADLIAVAGDERAVGFLMDHLGPSRDVAVALEHGGRADGVDDEAMEREVGEHLELLTQVERAVALDDFHTQAGDGNAVEGLEPVLSGLFQGRGATLLARATLDDERVAHHGREPQQVAAAPDPLRDLGLDPMEGPAVEVALRGAVGTGCDVVLLAPIEAPELDDGLGLVLRG